MIPVAVTTDRFTQVAEAFDLVGLAPVWLPCVRVEPADEGTLAQAREAAANAGLLLISSVRTLDVLWPDGAMPAVAVAAVGEQTAAAVAARGGRVELMGRVGFADLLELAADRLRPHPVVFPHAAGADPVALQDLAKATTDLRAFAVYRTVPIAPELTDVQAAAFASPSAVAGWLLSRRLDGLVVGVIGPTTWEAVARYRMPDVIAPQPHHHALAYALASFLEVAV